MSKEQTLIGQISAKAAVLREAVATAESEWQPAPPPPYLIMAEFAEIIEKNALSHSELERVFEDIEVAIANDGPAADLAAVGFLEPILGRAAAGTFDITPVVELLGPKSLEFCRLWDSHTGNVTIPRAAG